MTTTPTPLVCALPVPPTFYIRSYAGQAPVRCDDGQTGYVTFILNVDNTADPDVLSTAMNDVESGAAAGINLFDGTAIAWSEVR